MKDPLSQNRNFGCNKKTFPTPLLSIDLVMSHPALHPPVVGLLSPLHVHSSPWGDHPQQNLLSLCRFFCMNCNHCTPEVKQAGVSTLYHGKKPRVCATPAQILNESVLTVLNAPCYLETMPHVLMSFACLTQFRISDCITATNTISAQ